MSSADRTDGGAAFPQHLAIGPNGDVYGSAYYAEGMSLRDWFAAKAMSGWLASFGPEDAVKPASIATLAYEIADAMIAARKEGGA